jgi:hypothetical protein
MDFFRDVEELAFLISQQDKAKCIRLSWIMKSIKNHINFKVGYILLLGPYHSIHKSLKTLEEKGEYISLYFLFDSYFCFSSFDFFVKLPLFLFKSFAEKYMI